MHAAIDSMWCDLERQLPTWVKLADKVETQHAITARPLLDKLTGSALGRVTLESHGTRYRWHPNRYRVFSDRIPLRSNQRYGSRFRDYKSVLSAAQCITDHCYPTTVDEIALARATTKRLDITNRINRYIDKHTLKSGAALDIIRGLADDKCAVSALADLASAVKQQKTLNKFMRRAAPIRQAAVDTEWKIKKRVRK
jgi:hypothetical protein